MTLSEFSNNFDVLLNSFAHTAQLGKANNEADIVLNEHEKSVFLTKSQEELALSLYNGKNPYGESFEQTEELRRYLANLVTEAELSPIETSSGKPLGIDSNSKFFTLPDGTEDGKPAVWFITYEQVSISDGACEDVSKLEVVPIKQDEYHRIKKNPFRGANDRRALRLDLSENNVEIVSKHEVEKYYVRYLRKLNPIILTDLDGVDIEGKTGPTECELPSFLHQKILEGAVILALQSRGVNTKSENK